MLPQATGRVFSRSSSFPATENPISESGVWISSGAGRTDAQTDGTHAFGTMSSFDGTNYIDSIAYLKDWGDHNQQITATVKNSSAGGLGLEVELLLRATGPNAYYEIDFVNSSTEMAIVRMDGAANAFTVMTGGPITTNVSLVDGTSIVAKIIGNLITVTCGGNTVISNFDITTGFSAGAVYQYGSPGMGFWNETGTSGNSTKLGWKDWAAVSL